MLLIPFTNLYPSDDRPRHGIFVRERLENILALGGVRAEVVALRPWMPFTPSSRCRDSREATENLSVHMVGVPSVPKLSNWVDPLLWSQAAGPVVKSIVDASSEPVVIDAHFLYPDGAAAVLIGRRYGLPVVITARGSDVNVKCRNAVFRRWIRWAAAHSSAVISVSRDLDNRLCEYAIRAPRNLVLRNGVDLEKFRPLDRASCRASLGVSGRVLLSVGFLSQAKGHDLAIEALRLMNESTCLIIVGEGPYEKALRTQVAQAKLGQRVIFAGPVPHADLAKYYTAADVLVLASLREGMPNVVLESMACGTPIVAADVGGVREVINDVSAGEVVNNRSAREIAAAVERVSSACRSRSDVRDYAMRFGWYPVALEQYKLYEAVCTGSDDVSRPQELVS